MSSRSGRGVRALRGVTAAVFATFVATVSHSAADGRLPPIWSVVVAVCLASPVCMMLAGRRLSWWRLSIAVVLSQVLFHALLSIGFADGGAPSVTEAGHQHAAGAARMVMSHATASHPVSMSPWMLTAHAVAAVVTVIALGSAERAVRAMRELLRHPFLALAAFKGLPAVAAPPMQLMPRGVMVRLAVLSMMRRRGPPVAA